MPTRMKPGRVKGTHVETCACGRRVVGTAGKTVECSGCGVPLVIRIAGKAIRRPPTFIRPGKK